MDFDVRHFETVGSTNKLAFELIELEGIDEGTIIRADEQTDGKGQGENSWESDKGSNLTFTIVLRPFFIQPGEQFIITKMISVAIRNVVLQFISNQAVKIKWPNDIYIGDDKVAGILIQNIIKGNAIDYTVIGIGLNINQEVFKSDAPNPVSLIHFTGSPVSVDNVLAKLLTEIATIYAGIGSNQYRETLHTTYLENLYRYKQLVSFREGKKEFKATVEGTDAFGRLKLKMQNGTIRLFNFKEVEFL